MKTYLGDGAYAEIDQHGDLVLTTSDGIRTTNRIVLGNIEYAVLLAFMNRLRRERHAAEQEEQ